MTSLTRAHFTVRMKDMPADKIADYTSDHDIGREMFPACKTRHGDRCGRAVGQPFYPGPWVFVGYHACHRPSEQGVSGREGTVESVVAPETPIAAALDWPFPASDELQTHVNRQSIGESLGTQGARFTRMIIMCCQAREPENSRRRRGPIKTRA